MKDVFDVSFENQRSSKLHETNDAVDTFRKTVHKHLIALGYTRHVSLQSALYHWEYTLGKRKISLDGWHGTGRPGTSRYYGNARTFFSLYDSEYVQKEHWKPVVNCPCTHEDLTTLLGLHTAAMKAALEYVRGIR